MIIKDFDISYFHLAQGKYLLKFARNIGSSVVEKLYDIISESVLTVENGVEPPGVPHFGGCWEREIPSLKQALWVTLDQTISGDTL